MPIKSLIRTIPDYPKAGIQFRDITSLIQDPAGLHATVQALLSRYLGQTIHKVVGIEARGFIIGTPLAYALGVGFVPARKPGKLPGNTIGQDYALEYGTDRLEIHTDAIKEGEHILLVDDLLATGGTAEAAATLIKKMGGVIVECAFVVDLPDIGGRKRLENQKLPIFTLCEFEGD
jgi:adenine phosphoribosyltransferase